MAEDPLKSAAEVEIVCPSCGYHMVRTVARLRRDTHVVCASCGEVVVAKGSEDGESRKTDDR